MARQVYGWVLLLGSPGVAFSSLLIVNTAIDGVGSRTPVWAAGILVGVTLMFAVFGTAAGASVIARTPDRRRLAIPPAAFGGMAVYIACVYVAEKYLNWL